MDIVKIAVLGIAGVLTALPLKKEKSEYSTLIAITVCICIFVYLLTKVEVVLEFVKQLEDMLPVDGRYIGMLIKMIGTTYVAEFATNICKDAGYGAIASQIEVFAKLSILLISIPVLMAFLETVGNYL